MLKSWTKWILLSISILLVSCSGQTVETTAHAEPVQVSGRIDGLADTSLVFTYTPYQFLADQSTLSFEVDSIGQFSFIIDDPDRLKGFLSFGKVPRTYEFEFKTIDGKDTTGIVPSVDFRMVWLYLEPGDSLFLAVNANQIEETLHLSGKGANNNQFVNLEEFRFNDYKSKYLSNYYYKTFYQPDTYKEVTFDLTQTKIRFVKNFSQEHEVSSFLSKVYRENYLAQLYASWIYYPESHAGFNQGNYPELPADYYDFLHDIKPADSFHMLGGSYLSFLNAWMGRLFDQEYPEGADLETEYKYVLKHLPDEDGYRLLAYKLPRDFNAELYKMTTSECPYPEIAKLVQARFSHLKAMFPGSEVPEVVFHDIYDQPVRLADYAGQYLFLDFWATWCKPCIKEFPYLDEIKKQFAGENIVFIGISVDRAEDVEAWKTYVQEHELTGVQVHATREAYEPMKKAWNITSIPRFVIIDPAGKMHDARALRPSDPDLPAYLKGLL